MRISNAVDSNFLLQAELKSISQELEYKEEVKSSGNRYKGYVNQLGQREGVGINITVAGQKQTGEWHLDKFNGCGKVEFENGNKYWGEFKDQEMDGYGITEFSNGSSYIGQWKQNDKHGYGIYRWPDGGFY